MHSIIAFDIANLTLEKLEEAANFILENQLSTYFVHSSRTDVSTYILNKSIRDSLKFIESYKGILGSVTINRFFKSEFLEIECTEFRLENTDHKSERINSVAKAVIKRIMILRKSK